MSKHEETGATRGKRGGLGWLDRVERLGNRLPDPVAIFLILIAILIGLSVVASSFEWSAINPSNDQIIQSKSLLSIENVRRIFVEMPATFTGFKPLGMVLVVMLGAAIAERSGLFATLMNRAIRGVGGRFLTPAIFVIGLMSHHADDAAYVVIIPLAALAFAQAGRHPLAGVAIAYAGISGAFAANLLPGQFDVLILGITQTAAHFVDPNYGLNPLGNWFFTATLGLLLIPITWFVNDRIVESRLGPWTGGLAPEPIDDEKPHTASLEAEALRRAGIAALAVIGLFAALTVFPAYQPLIDQDAEGPARLAPFYASLVAGFALLFAATGWAYGSVVGSITSHRDVVRMMARGLEATTPYLVLFGWSNLGPILAIKGAGFLTHLNAPVALLLVVLLILSSAFDLAIGSASAKWTAMAPIVVPMLMLIGVSPEMTTAAYRMGDSVFNIVTPVASNFALVLVLAQRWRHDFGIGSLIALMLPFSMAIGITGLSLIAIWATFELPTGPGAIATYVTAGAR
jgi:aminobenzoyl-glutamate transport protein